MTDPRRLQAATMHAAKLRRNVLLAIATWITIGVVAAASLVWLAACQAYAKVIGGKAEAANETRNTTVILTPPSPAPMPTRTIILIPPKEKPCSSPPASASSDSSPPPPSAR